MGREFASAAARWVHVDSIGARPHIVAVCDTNPEVLSWHERLDSPPRLCTAYEELLADVGVGAAYCAVPHNLHEEMYTAAVEAGKRLLGEKRFGVGLPANTAINSDIARRADLLIRCSSEMPF